MKKLTLIAFIFLIFSCAKKEITKDDSYYYNQGIKSVKRNLYQEAAESFSNVGKGNLYIKAQIMEAYSYYKTKLYNDAIAIIENLRNSDNEIQKEDRMYLNYLQGMAYYKQLAHYKASQQYSKLAFENFQKINENQPIKNKWQDDSSKKLKIIRDKISRNYIYLGKYYLKTENFIPAINAFNAAAYNVYSADRRAEALYRLAEIYYYLGIKSKSLQLLNIIDQEYDKQNKWRNYGKKLKKSLIASKLEN